MDATESSPLDLTSPEAWTAAACRPSSGTGTLARLGRVTLLVGSTDPDTVAPLLGQAEMVEANGGQGRQLVRGYALLLGTTTEDTPPFAAFAPHETGLAVLVSGDATVVVNGERISGRDSLAWVERLVPWPITSLSATVDPAAAPQPHFRLGEGVVPAGGLELGAGTTSVEPVLPVSLEVPVEARSTPPPAPQEPAMVETPAVGTPVPEPVVAPVPEPMMEPVMEPEPAVADAPAPPPPPAPAAPVPPPPPPPPAPERPAPPVLEDHVGQFDSVLLRDVDGMDDLDPPAPLPIVEDERDVTNHGHGAEQVRGVFCKNRHFNDPRQLFCAVCGINMVQQTPVLVNGTRPPLGVVVLDDGAVFQLDSDYLLGRDPDSDERVRSGEVRGVPVQDTSNQISRVHARIELRGWDVVLVDNASTNGTYVNPPQSPGWTRLPSGGELVLEQGTRVRLGHRTLAFNTHAGASA